MAASIRDTVAAARRSSRRCGRDFEGRREAAPARKALLLVLSQVAYKQGGRPTGVETGPPV
jgi:hypothetical protein